MSEYQERLVQSDVTFIHNRVAALRKVLEREDSLELASVESEIGLLEKVSTEQLIPDHHANRTLSRVSNPSETSWKLPTSFS